VPSKLGEPSVDKQQLRRIAPGLSRGIRLPGEVEDEVLDLDVDEAGGIEGALEEQVSLVYLSSFSDLDIKFCGQGGWYYYVRRRSDTNRITSRNRRPAANDSNG
jgi:hypothetical protein